MVVDDRDWGFYGRFPRSISERHSEHGWQDKYVPESQSYYSRLHDGNYYRLPGCGDGLPDHIQGIHIQAMKQRCLEWDGDLPNRILSIVVERMQKLTEVLTDEIAIMAELHMVDEAFHNDIHGLEELLDKGTTRRMKRLEIENKHYKKQYDDYKKMYIGAGQKIKELNAEVKRLKQFEPITINPESLSDKTDITRRFATMDLM